MSARLRACLRLGASWAPVVILGVTVSALGCGRERDAPDGTSSAPPQRFDAYIANGALRVSVERVRVAERRGEIVLETRTTLVDRDGGELGRWDGSLTVTRGWRPIAGEWRGTGAVEGALELSEVPGAPRRPRLERRVEGESPIALDAFEDIDLAIIGDVPATQIGLCSIAESEPRGVVLFPGAAAEVRPRRRSSHTTASGRALDEVVLRYPSGSTEDVVAYCDGAQLIVASMGETWLVADGETALARTLGARIEE